jgi:uncharacterized damage-inducible protein DinB
MKKSDLHILFRYNQWANGRILAKAAKLTTEQLTDPSNLAGENLYNTLIHMFDTEWSWRLACQEGAMPGVELTADSWPDFTAFKRAWQEEMDLMLDYVETLNEKQINQTHEYIWTAKAKPRQLTLWKILLHIANHGTHHRAETGRQLNSLGQSPKDMDFIIWASRHAK